MQRYNPKDIEPKWQAKWDQDGTYVADLRSDKPKYMAMSMFNYPSGAGIHIGHAMNYTISDVKARFRRQLGYESYHPVGWDAFGLPAENYAIKTGVSPQASMAKIIPDYHKQYKAMGWSNDWTKEIATHQPEYYKWTQWIFSQMYRNGLAYQDARMQWWCTKCQTVLANEQVIDGKCWRHDGPDDPIVEKREVKQWFFKITDYADELLEAIEDLDWSDSVKLAQKNWIGKSVGAEVDFKLQAGDGKITVFTTRPDTLYGATFLVLAPEHELVTAVTTDEKRVEVEAYVKQAEAKTEVERQANKEKTGIFTGSFAVNPMTDEQIPIWIADYVLTGYGTGAIMAVPAHDERDHEFAQKFELPIRQVVHSIIEIKTSDTQQIDYLDGIKGMTWQSRSEAGVIYLYDIAIADVRNELDKRGIKYEFVADQTVIEGVMVNSGIYDGQLSQDVREKIVVDLESKGIAQAKVNYKMRDWSVSRQRYWGAPIPIIHCQKCGPQLVPDEQLPVVLPELEDFQPSGDGRSALARATDWLTVDCPQCGGPAERETDTLDTYICSSWYMWRYLDPHNQERIFDSELAKKWEPVDFYNGADHATAHLLYARFVTRFFAKQGLLDNPEPFKQFLFNGKVTASDGTMFSKSKGNGVDPLDIIAQGYGADALRTYLMFAAPLEVWVKWDPQGVPGAFRFLSRAWNLVQEYLEAAPGETSEADAQDIRRTSHRMVKKMTEDIERNQYNTAISAAMTTVNDLFKLKVTSLAKNDVWQDALDKLVASIAPFAPHIAEELWHELGHETSVHRGSWPNWDDDALQTETVTVVVQVNGRLRAQLQVAIDAVEQDIVARAQAEPNVAMHLDGKQLVKTIFVPGKLVNFVVR